MGHAAAIDLALTLGATALGAALLVRIAIAYAHRRALFDLPGRRRSHRVPTPRGGGIAIVVAALVASFLAPPVGAVPGGAVVALAVALVAVVGWIDDHRGLRAAWRLLAHVVAAVLVLATWWPDGPAATLDWPLEVGIAGLLVLGITWSINLHNFMDGIDGLLAWQAVFVFVVLALLAATAGDAAQARVLALWAAATTGFLPFNFPRARIFMGDVGSGALGLVIAIGLLWQAPAHAAIGLVACSAFIVDASCTLCSRLVHGRRWYSAHREHLYQWLVRRGLSHARVVALYMGWNLLVVVPVIILLQRLDPALQRVVGAACVIAVHGAGVAVWWLGKRACLRRPHGRRSPCCAS